MDRDKRKFLLWARVAEHRAKNVGVTDKITAYFEVIADVLHVLEPCELGGKAMERFIKEFLSQRPLNTTILETLKYDARQLVEFAPEVLAEIEREAQGFCNDDRDAYLDNIAVDLRAGFPTWRMDANRIAANLGKIAKEEAAVISYVVGEVLEDVESAAAEMWIGISKIREESFKLPRILDTERAAVAIRILREEGSVGIADDRRHLEWRGESLSQLAFVADVIWKDDFKTFPTSAIAELFQEPGFVNARKDAARHNPHNADYYRRLLRDLPPLQQ